MTRRRIDYNALADWQKFNGWSFEALLTRLVDDAAQQFGTCDCEEQSVCVHTAAAAFHGLMRIINHPDDCPECAAIHNGAETK